MRGRGGGGSERGMRRNPLSPGCAYIVGPRQGTSCHSGDAGNTAVARGGASDVHSPFWVTDR